MLVRIVRMHFKEEGVQEFLTIFNSNKIAIRHFRGCSHLELLSDVHHPATYTTLSHWDNEASLNAYRDSDIFKTVWTGVKKHFSRQPEAFSLEKQMEIE
jgi:heme oxygenase (mycobilin-producing)